MQLLCGDVTPHEGAPCPGSRVPQSRNGVGPDARLRQRPPGGARCPDRLGVGGQAACTWPALRGLTGGSGARGHAGRWGGSTCHEPLRSDPDLLAAPLAGAPRAPKSLLPGTCRPGPCHLWGLLRGPQAAGSGQAIEMTTGPDGTDTGGSWEQRQTIGMTDVHGGWEGAPARAGEQGDPTGHWGHGEL